MIKFFRKIRQKLISENKFSKYIIYATGEIVLVVIGILITVQINNWNEREKHKESELVYLNRLTTNLSYDIKLYDLIIQKDSLLKKRLYEVFSHVSRPDSSGLEPSRDFKSLVEGYGFVSNRTTIDSLISSGNVEEIRSNYLLEDIFLYYRTTDDMQKGLIRPYLNTTA